MAGSKPHILLIGGDGGYSGVPTYLALLTEALAGEARFTLLSDQNLGGYDFAARNGHTHAELPGLRTTINPMRALRALRALAQRVDRDAPDLVWAHARMAVLLLRVLAVWRRLRGQTMPPLAITFHGLPFGPGHRPISAPLARPAEVVFLRLMPPHHLLFLSEAATNTYAKGPGRKGHMARHQAHVLQNCSHLGPLPPAPLGPSPMLVMSGRAGYQKNHAAAARILAHLPPDHQLLICGGGTETAAFRQRFTRASGLPEAEVARRVRFIGPLADLRPLLQQADLFLLTSRYEGMPIAALEAFEAGLPIAVTDIPGLDEIAAAHPMVAVLRPDEPALAAQQITALVAQYRADVPGNNDHIRRAWQQEFSYVAWRSRAIALTARLTGKDLSTDPGQDP